MRHARLPLQFAMRLTYITRQRPADIFKTSLNDIENGYLHVKQNKTKAKLRIVINNDLAALINEMKSFKDKVSSSLLNMHLLVDEKGNPITKAVFQTMFSQARRSAGIAFSDFQFKDIRAKSATEIEENKGIGQTQKLLGRTTPQMTEQYIRNKAGKIVTPIDEKLFRKKIRCSVYAPCSMAVFLILRNKKTT